MQSEPPFRQQVYRVVRQIPRGKVASYGLVSRFLAGRVGAARLAVGAAMRDVPETGVEVGLPPSSAARMGGWAPKGVFGEPAEEDCSI